MRIIFSERTKELIDTVAPYMKFVPDVGMVLSEDAPPDVVAARKELDEKKDEIKGY